MPNRRLNIRRECIHGGTHKHGTERAYTADKCRCTPCADARSARDMKRRKLIAYGRWERTLVSAEPVREHMLALRERGIGWNRVAELASVGAATAAKIVEGRQPTCERATAAAILAVPLNAAPYDGAYVDGTGTRRRIEALACLGWTFPAQLERLGRKDRSGLQKVLNGGKVTAATAEAVREMYEELWDTPPEPATPAEKVAVTKARNLAIRKGYAPPLAWDDETIDDPDARPDGKLPPRTRRRDFDSLVEDVEWLMRTGATADEIADRLELKPTSVEQALRRGGRGDLANLFGRKSVA